MEGLEYVRVQQSGAIPKWRILFFFSYMDNGEIQRNAHLDFADMASGGVICCTDAHCNQNEAASIAFDNQVEGGSDHSKKKISEQHERVAEEELSDQRIGFSTGLQRYITLEEKPGREHCFASELHTQIKTEELSGSEHCATAE